MKKIVSATALLTLLFALIAVFYFVDQDVPTEAAGIVEAEILEPSGGPAVREKVANQHLDVFESAPAKPAEETDVSYENAAEYLDNLNKVTREWREKRGYHFAEDFIGYRDPESYTGAHPYGYLGEQELKALSDSGDPDAQMLYAYYYLKRKDLPATIDLYREVAINTEQTAPLGSIGATKIVTSRQKWTENPDAYSEEQKQSEENEAYAYFQLMKDRQDPMADRYLEMAEYDAFSDERKASIKLLANKLGESFLAARAERGLPPYVDEPLDLAKKLGVSEAELKSMQEKYSAVIEDEAFIEQRTASTTRDDSYGYKSDPENRIQHYKAGESGETTQ